MSSLFGTGYGGYGYGSPYGYSAMGVYNYLPSWGVSNFAGWGLGSYATTSLYSNYTNPYYATVVAAQPAQTTVVYDYSQPINVTSTPPDASVAREHRAGVFGCSRLVQGRRLCRAHSSSRDQVLKQTPDAAVVHEFRALCLFALKRYDEAAAVDYAVLTAGPGWNWSTLVGLYPDVDTYTNQLRALEAFVRTNPARRPGSSCWRITTSPRAITMRREPGSKRWWSWCPPTSSRPVSPSSTRRRPRCGRGPAGAASTRPGQPLNGSAAEQPWRVLGQPAHPASPSRSPRISPRRKPLRRRRRRRTIKTQQRRTTAASASQPGRGLEGPALARRRHRADARGRRQVRLGGRHQGEQTDAQWHRRLQGQCTSPCFNRKALRLWARSPRTEPTSLSSHPKVPGASAPG